MHPFLPHTDLDISGMLEVCGLEKLEDLFSDIPASLRLSDDLELPKGISEFEAFRNLETKAGKNRVIDTSYLGCGSYDHIIPHALGRIISLPQFYTAYTPYQPEISQGFLQAIFEFQTMICSLTSLDVANASLYDGHTAASEAAVLSLQTARRRNTVLYSETLHPHTKQVLHTHFLGTGVVLREVTCPGGSSSIDSLKGALDDDTACFIAQSPNFFGYLEDYSGCADLLHENGSLFVISSNPLSLAVTRSQGEWGADIGIGDTQVFGLPRFFGGPSCGYIAAAEKLMRKMPGRIVGQSVDTQGRRAFLLTLQAREQHIKRKRATSNICSNQALAALASTVYLALLGEAGLKETAGRNMTNAAYLHRKLLELPGVEPLSEQPFFNEFSLLLPVPAASMTERMRDYGIMAGVPLSAVTKGGNENTLIIAVTEKRTKEELDAYIAAAREVLA